MRRTRVAGGSLSCLFLSLALAGGAVAQTAAYNLVDNVEGNWVNMNPIPVRPMTLSQAGTDLYVCNAYNSEVSRINGSLSVVQRFRTLWGPVSIAQYVNGATDVLLVVCQHSNALAVHDRASGDILRIIDLPPEPADLLVDQTNGRAFVSCTATDEVVEINLQTWVIDQSYSVNSKVPTFLSFDRSGEVLVAPRWSGNNSAVHRAPPHPAFPNDDMSPQAMGLGILDLADPSIATQGLPDHDLFWLNRTTGQAEPVAAGVGTILLAQGFNPVTGRFWQLNTEANNKDPNKQTEPSIRGFISTNRLTMLDLPPLGSGQIATPAPSDIVDLDDIDPSTPGTQYDPNRSIGIPYSLAFSRTGWALAAGLLSDNIVLISPSGQRFIEWNLPAGTMPRQILLDASETFFVVYGGDNRVHLFLLAPPPSLLTSIDIGFDPTPADVREGRRLFFQANALNGNASCATCHDEGKHDMLAWNLSNGDKDDKGPMVTQTLVGIGRTTTFHWRGEQQENLLDFNGAFPNLLGGQELATGTGSDFEKFEKFVLSLTQPANPNQNRNRVLDDTIQPPVLAAGAPAAFAVNGQAEFTTGCASCHSLPVGTSNDLVPDGGVFREPIPKRQWVKIAPLHALPYKAFMPDVQVTWNPAHPVLGSVGTQIYPLLGTGLTHGGNPRNAYHFAEFFFGLGQLDQRTSDVTGFMHQFDQGVAPAVHEQVFMDRTTVISAAQELGSYLLPQAAAGNCDVAVFGRTTINGQNRVFAWTYFPSNGMFLRDTMNWNAPQFFLSQAQAGGSWFVFVGVPVGMGISWGIDTDNDLFPAGLESAAGQSTVDTDGDTFWDGHEFWNGSDPFNAASTPNDIAPPTTSGVNLDWVTAKVARLTFTTNELTKFKLSYFSPTGATVQATRSDMQWHHSIVLSGFSPGSTYQGTITIEDLAGLTTNVALPSLTTQGFNDPPGIVVVGDLQWTSVLQTPGGPTTFNASVRVDEKISGAAMADHLVVARALVNGVPATTNLTASPTSFKVNGVPYAAIPGPFVISQQLTGATGHTNLTFSLTGLLATDVVQLSIESVGPAFDPTNHVSTDPDMAGTDVWPDPPIPLNWSFPDTKKANRCIQWP